MDWSVNCILHLPEVLEADGNRAGNVLFHTGSLVWRKYSACMCLHRLRTNFSSLLYSVDPGGTRQHLF